jgi:DNA-binding IclR family transcriptional regulator
MNTNRSTVRTIEIMHLIASSSNELTITEISHTLNIPKSTTHQIIQTLQELKILENSKPKTFRLGIRFFEMALPAFARMDLRREAESILEDLSAKTGESVFMATHDGDQIVYLDQVMGPSLLRLSVNPGTRGPIHCTALGKAILASFPNEKVTEILGKKRLERFTDFTIQNHEQLINDLNKTRVRGFAIDDRELFPDISCIAAPVLRSAGEPAAAISIVSHSSRMNSSRIEELGVLLQEAVLNLSRRLGFEGQKLFDSQINPAKF